MNMNRNPAERWASQNERRMAGNVASEPKAKSPKPNFEKAVATLREATAAHRAIYVARAEEIYMTGLVGMRAALTAAGMDLNKVAPYPKTNMGRKEYRMMLAAHKRYTFSFADAEDRPISFTGRLNGTLPWLVKEKADAESKVRAEARRDANACFDAYLYKLAGKIVKSITSAALTGNLWNGSTLQVECEDGEKQTWTTKCIINQSIYGKLFNQWPTRRTL